MTKIFDQEAPEKQEETKKEVKDKLEDLGIPTPGHLEDAVAKMTKTERRLAHTIFEHLYVGVIQQLQVAKKELEDIVEKKNDERAKALLTGVNVSLDNMTISVDFMKDKVPGLATVAEMDKVMLRLTEELEMAQMLQMMSAPEGTPKEDMH